MYVTRHITDISWLWPALAHVHSCAHLERVMLQVMFTEYITQVFFVLQEEEEEEEEEEGGAEEEEEEEGQKTEKAHLYDEETQQLIDGWFLSFTILLCGRHFTVSLECLILKQNVLTT